MASKGFFLVCIALCIVIGCAFPRLIKPDAWCQITCMGEHEQPISDEDRPHIYQACRDFCWKHAYDFLNPTPTPV